tara:strand:- start:342 stop:695 length:354 start_codon:yes stop_codon:yes gene_type:complete
MAIFSSHILNALDGTHASKVKLKLLQIESNDNKKILLNTETDENGRIFKEFNLTQIDCKRDYEIVINIEDYFLKNFKTKPDKVISEIVIRLKMKNNNKKYHIPIIISPNSYSIWWSK